jgi:ATP-dependent RNA helicase RhlB
VAGRGIHIEGMDHVINFMLPRDPEDYVHRIGRTGRAGAAGTSISFADEKDAFYLPAIEAFIEQKLNCIEPEEEWLTMPKPIPGREKNRSRRRRTSVPTAKGKSRPRPKRRRPRRSGQPAHDKTASSKPS